MKFDFSRPFGEVTKLGTFKNYIKFIHAYNETKMRIGSTSEAEIIANMRGYDIVTANTLLRAIKGQFRISEVPSKEHEADFMNDYYTYMQTVHASQRQRVIDARKNYNEKPIHECGGVKFSSSELEKKVVQAKKDERKSKRRSTLAVLAGIALGGALTLFGMPLVLPGLTSFLGGDVALVSAITTLASIAVPTIGGVIGYRSYNNKAKRASRAADKQLLEFWESAVDESGLSVKDLVAGLYSQQEAEEARLRELESDFGLELDESSGLMKSEEFHNVFSTYTTAPLETESPVDESAVRPVSEDELVDEGESILEDTDASLEDTVNDDASESDADSAAEEPPSPYDDNYEEFDDDREEEFDDDNHEEFVDEAPTEEAEESLVVDDDDYEEEAFDEAAAEDAEEDESIKSEEEEVVEEDEPIEAEEAEEEEEILVIAEDAEEEAEAVEEESIEAEADEGEAETGKYYEIEFPSATEEMPWPEAITFEPVPPEDESESETISAAQKKKLKSTLAGIYTKAINVCSAAGRYMLIDSRESVFAKLDATSDKKEIDRLISNAKKEIKAVKEAYRMYVSHIKLTSKNGYYLEELPKGDKRRGEFANRDLPIKYNPQNGTKRLYAGMLLSYVKQGRSLIKKYIDAKYRDSTPAEKAARARALYAKAEELRNAGIVFAEVDKAAMEFQEEVVSNIGLIVDMRTYALEERTEDDFKALVENISREELDKLKKSLVDDRVLNRNVTDGLRAKKRYLDASEIEGSPESER